MSETRYHPARGDELDEVARFYERQGYTANFGADETVLLARVDGEIAAAVRLAHERGEVLLRGMFVDEEHQRCGIGSNMLRQLDGMLGDRRCFCLSLRHLQGYYNTVGFQVCPQDEVPVFLGERADRYRAKGYDIGVLRRPGHGGLGTFPSTPE